MSKTWIIVIVLAVVLVTVVTLLQMQQTKQIAEANQNKGLLGVLIGS